MDSEDAPIDLQSDEELEESSRGTDDPSDPSDHDDSRSPPDPNINVIIGSYKIISKVEATTTYKCQHNLTREMFICSIINTEQYYNFLAKYERIKDHPGINKVQEIITQQDKNLVIYGQNYGNFHEYAQNRVRMPENEAVYFFHQMVIIVHDLHNLGIIIRDLKLRRFVFRDVSRRKIVLETWDDSILLSDPVNDCLSDKYGCPTYASPELIDKTVTCYSGKKADTWGLGIILFAMLTGRYPFYHQVPSQMLQRIERGYYIMPDYISRQASQLIQGLLAKNPVSRFTTNDIFQSDWFRVYNLHNTRFLTDSRGGAGTSSGHSFTFPTLLPVSQHSFSNPLYLQQMRPSTSRRSTYHDESIGQLVSTDQIVPELQDTSEEEPST